MWISDPNPDVGLVHSPFELALLDVAGGIIAIKGLEGMPGFAVSTIYRLPPGGEFGLNRLSVPSGKTVASVGLTLLGK